MALVFLLSPAYCGGRRAAQLLRPGSTLPIAQRLSAGALTLGEAFAFCSGLYFRGKLTYAQAFGRGTDRHAGTLIITPTRGLLRPDLPVTGDLLREFAEIDVAADAPRYRQPLERTVTELAHALAPGATVVLLGSIASGKYVDVLSTILGSRLHYPASFIGRGDMSRGGLLLRSVTAGTELEYVVFDPAASRRGARPPKLEPISARRSALGDRRLIADG